MSGYTYAKANPDWDRAAASDLRANIKAFCLIAVLRNTDEGATFKRIREEIDVFCREFSDMDNGEEIAARYRIELAEFAREAYEMAMTMVGTMTPYMFAQALVDPARLTGRQKTALEQSVPVTFEMTEKVARRAAQTVYREDTGGGYTNATPAHTFYTEIHKEAKSRMGEFEDLKTHKIPMANLNPRNIVEMAVRWDKYKEEKARLKANGVRLVYVPPHANCSKRCQPYQGKVYSLTGQTERFDGRVFPPIEDAADNVTVRGKKDPSRVYAAGLFAYNCRHRMVPYQEGQNVEVIPAEAIERRRELETKQRELERDVRYLKEKYTLLRIVRDESGNKNLAPEVKEACAAWKASREKYFDFCEKNDLVTNGKRLTITVGEDLYKRTSGKYDPRVTNTKLPPGTA